MRCRKNVKALTQDEKDAFIRAIEGLKAADSVLHPGDQSRYDDYVEIHRGAMDSAQIDNNGNVISPGWGHFDSAFFPWHRELLYRFEEDLRAVEPDVTIPYWDWTRGQSALDPGWPFTHDFIGVDGTDLEQDKVKREAGAPSPYPYEFDPEAWTVVVTDTPGALHFLRRGMGERADAPDLPENDTTVTGTNTNFRAAIGTATYLVARARAEDLHNLVHRWVNGSMITGSSPNDPVFWMHHANIDRMWTLWQEKHPAATPYVHNNNFAGHGLNDTMIYHEVGDTAPWGGTATPNQMIDGHAIHGISIWYATDLPEITPPAGSLDFGTVPQGMTQYRAVRFEVRTCRPLRFRITGAPTGNFAPTDLGLQFTLDPDLAADSVEGLVWVQFVANGGSPQFSSVAIEAYLVDEEGYYAATENGEFSLGTYTVTLSASVAAREDNAVVMVLDRSGSMAASAGGANTRTGLMKSGVSVFHALLRPTDEIGIVSFDDVTDNLLPLTTQAAGLGTTLTGSGLDPRGTTGIGLGIQAGAAMLAGANHSNRSLLVLTDGNQNVHPFVEELPPGTITSRTYAIGFGLAGQVSDATLNAITQNTAGDLIVTGLLGTDAERYLLTKYFVQMLAGITRTNIVLDPQSQLLVGSEHVTSFRVTEADVSIDVIVLATPAPFVDVQLITPDGTRIDPALAATAPNISFHLHPDVTFYRLDLPALPADPGGSHAGIWNVVTRVRDDDEVKRLLANEKMQFDPLAVRQLAASRALSYSCIVHARSNLDFSAQASQSEFGPGSRVALSASLREYGVPFTGEAIVRAEVTGPRGDAFVVDLKPDRDGAKGGYSAAFVAAAPGVYQIRVRARGGTSKGSAFTREKTLSAAVFAGRPQDSGDEPGGGGPGGGRPGGGKGGDDRGTMMERLRKWLGSLFHGKSEPARSAEPCPPAGAPMKAQAEAAPDLLAVGVSALIDKQPEPAAVDWPDEASRRERAARMARQREAMTGHHDPGLMMFPPFDDEGRAILHEHGADCPPDCGHVPGEHDHGDHDHGEHEHGPDCPPDCGHLPGDDHGDHDHGGGNHGHGDPDHGGADDDHPHGHDRDDGPGDDQGGGKN